MLYDWQPRCSTFREELFQFANARLCTNRNISSFRLILFFAKLDDFACLAKFIFCVISGNLSRTAKIISIPRLIFPTCKAVLNLRHETVDFISYSPRRFHLKF